MPSVAAAGSAPRHKLLAPKRQTAVAAVACFYRNSNFVDEHFDEKENLKKKRGGLFSRPF
jgi:hypothetical protein